MPPKTKASANEASDRAATSATGRAARRRSTLAPVAAGQDTSSAAAATEDKGRTPPTKAKAKAKSTAKPAATKGGAPLTETGASSSAAGAELRDGKRSNRTFYLPDELYVRGRNAVAWTSLVPGEAGSYAALTERALRTEVERLEKLYNEGEPFEDAQLKRGPAAGVMERVHALRAKARQAQEEDS